jgi:ribosome-binding protein aMBF1 (putative translation factor)
MTEDKKTGQQQPAAPAGETRAEERLEREPVVHVERQGKKTIVTIDLDQFAEEADEALQRGFEELRRRAEYLAQEAQLDYIAACHKQKERLKLSDADLARKMEVSRSYVSRIMHATPNLSVVSLAKIAQALGGKIRIELVVQDKDDEIKQ